MPADNDHLEQIRLALFNTTAPRYQLIMPAFGPLAERLVARADLTPTDTVLDLGTGSGAVALPAARRAGRVAAIDYAPAMLQQASQGAAQPPALTITFYQGDMHRLPHASHSFDAALASFGLNGTDPARVFAEIWRVLGPAGRLIFQEWGKIEEASRLVKRAIKAHRVAQADGFLADLRQLGQAPKAWDLLNGPEAIVALLKQIGFNRVEIKRERESISLEPLAFYRYKTAWTPYQAELAAMPVAERATLEAEVVATLQSWAGEDGRFVWQPELMRVSAWK